MKASNTELTGLPLESMWFCALDVETTQVPNEQGGLALIEVAAIRFQGDSEEPEFRSLVNPKCDIRPFDTHVSGISNSTVKRAPLFRYLYDDFYSYVSDTVILAHNASFDKRAIECQCSRDGLQAPNNIYIDTCLVMRKVAKLTQYNLETACSYFGIKQVDAHRATGDCRAVRLLFRCMIPLLAQLYGVTRFGQLCSLLNIEIYERPKQGNLFDLS